jgi:hypothetical protein
MGRAQQVPYVYYRERLMQKEKTEQRVAAVEGHGNHPTGVFKDQPTVVSTPGNRTFPLWSTETAPQ